mmetsp:Transcript_14672/g.44000  ORF Transcript_14672/g.44000 Transcript_14672/m.44000 type:complete len:288 (-) Transcript_14672:25-888(-)
MAKTVLVTGGNSGIGFALSKLLATEHGCAVLLGSRDEKKGSDAVAAIKKLGGKSVELVVIDVASDASVAAAAEAVKAMGVTLYALVNNAGIGLNNFDGKGGAEAIVNVNTKGPKRVSEAFVGMIDPKIGRIVNMSSGVASMWVREQDAATKALYSNPDITQEQLDADVAKQLAAGNVGMGGGYGISKAALTAYTLVQAKTHPNLVCVSITPGFIQTNMTKGFGAKLSPEQGCVSALKTLFGDVTSGFYYGSDGLRSPLICTRDPGTPEYGGEPNPDPTRYNNNTYNN